MLIELSQFKRISNPAHWQKSELPWRESHDRVRTSYHRSLNTSKSAIVTSRVPLQKAYVFHG